MKLYISWDGCWLMCVHENGMYEAICRLTPAERTIYGC